VPLTSVSLQKTLPLFFEPSVVRIVNHPQIDGFDPAQTHTLIFPPGRTHLRGTIFTLYLFGSPAKALGADRLHGSSVRPPDRGTLPLPLVFDTPG